MAIIVKSDSHFLCIHRTLMVIRVFEIKRWHIQIAIITLYNPSRTHFIQACGAIKIVV